MVNAEAFIAGWSQSLRKELAEKEEADQAYKEKLLRGLSAAQSTSRKPTRKELQAQRKEEKERQEWVLRMSEMHTLRTQVKLLEELQATLKHQQAETKAHFPAIKVRDEHSSKQNLWITVATSAIALIIGWLLSMLGTPAAVLHALVR